MLRSGKTNAGSILINKECAWLNSPAVVDIEYQRMRLKEIQKRGSERSIAVGKDAAASLVRVHTQFHRRRAKLFGPGMNCIPNFIGRNLRKRHSEMSNTTDYSRTGADGLRHQVLKKPRRRLFVGERYLTTFQLLC
jgi:hypothetical protein